MPVPGTQEIRKPLLEIFKDEAPHNFVINELLELIAGKINAELEEMSSTEKTAFKNNINDAINYLLKNKLLRHPSKTTYLISKTGSEILAEDPELIDDAYLKKFKAVSADKQIVKAPTSAPEPEIIEEEQAPTPESSEETDELEDVGDVEEIEEEIEETDEDFDIPVGLDEDNEQEEQESEETEDVLEENTTLADEESEKNIEEVTGLEEQEVPEDIENIEEEPHATENLDTEETEIPEESGDIDESIQETEPEFEEVAEPEQDQEQSSGPETEMSDDDGIDAEDFDEVENVEETDADVEEIEDNNEIESEIEEETEIESENENEDIKMNEPELDATLEAAEEASQEEIEEIEVEETEDEDEESEEPSGTAQDFSDLNIEDLVQQYNEKLADGVLTRIESFHQDNFCMLVMDLLSKMGYRVFQTARYTNEAEGSDLIQGIILENKPGMNPIYIQARKLSSSKTVSKADMLDFVNALSDKGGKGMFVTVGNFSKSAEDVARDEGIMLVDGKKLAGLMISNNFCVNTEKVFELKAIDLESFDEYEG